MIEVHDIVWTFGLRSQSVVDAYNDGAGLHREGRRDWPVHVGCATDDSPTMSVQHTRPTLPVTSVLTLALLVTPHLGLKQTLGSVYDDLDILGIGNNHLLRDAATQHIYILRQF